jgi:hypothetical protein
MVSQVPSPTHVNKSRHGGKVPNFEPQETIRVWFIFIKVDDIYFIYKEKSKELVLQVGSSFLLDPALNRNPKPKLQKMMPCSRPCHTWDLGLGTHVK